MLEVLQTVVAGLISLLAQEITHQTTCDVFTTSCVRWLTSRIKCVCSVCRGTVHHDGGHASVLNHSSQLVCQMKVRIHGYVVAAGSVLTQTRSQLTSDTNWIPVSASILSITAAL